MLEEEFLAEEKDLRHILTNTCGGGETTCIDNSNRIIKDEI